jgi:polyphosphate kinase
MSQDSWSPADRAWLESHSTARWSRCCPLGLDPARPSAHPEQNLNFIVRLQGKMPSGDTELAVVQVPRSLPRVVPLPGPQAESAWCCCPTSRAVHSAAVPRHDGDRLVSIPRDANSDLFVDEEVDDLRLALEGELAQRRYGAAVRLETSMDCPDETVDFLLQQFALKRQDLYRVPGPVNLNRLSAIYDLAGRSDLKYPPFAPALPANPAPALDVFEQLRAGDLLLHHPFQSFAPVMDFLRLAASDPQVLAIKQTLYRVGAASPIVDALVAAAHNGKDVTTIIELRARFDEEANIGLANRLQEAGVHVMYGVVGYKTHAKMILVVRRETDGIRRYCHLGTGNYHPRTARAYTDYGLLTANETIGLDVHEIFLQLTSLTRTPQLRLLLQSPFTLHARLLELIRAEAARGSAGRITARMNALTEPQVIEALYDASRAGAQVDLVVRGTCVLRPGLPGVSDNIRVRSIVGRFLEHPRLWCFGSGGEAQVYCSSADWMERNFFRRVEIAFPILDPALRASLQADLAAYLADTADAWLLAADGTYQRAPVGGEGPVSAQARLLERYTSGREHAQP